MFFGTDGVETAHREEMRKLYAVARNQFGDCPHIIAVRFHRRPMCFPCESEHDILCIG
jgi:hypothetical protein